MHPFYRFIHTLVLIILKIVWGFRVIGGKNLPAEGPVIVACNHISAFDPPALAVALYREAHFAAKKELFGIPVIGRLISMLNAFPVRRDGFDNRAVKHSIKALKEGGVLIMFPEGTRSRTGEMLPFRRGIGFIVDKTDAAVLPAYITGSDKIKKRILKPGGITIKFGEIVYNLNSIYSGSDKFERIARHVRDEVEKLI